MNPSREEVHAQQKQWVPASLLVEEARISHRSVYLKRREIAQEAQVAAVLYPRPRRVRNVVPVRERLL